MRWLKDSGSESWHTQRKWCFTELELNRGDFTSWENVCESCKLGHIMHIQAGYPEPCKIPGSNSCKACMCLLNSVPQHRWLPLGHQPGLQLGSRAWQLLMMPLREEMADKPLCSQMPRPLVYSLCQKFLIMVPETPSSAGFQFSQLGRRLFFTWHERWMQLSTW